MLRFPEQYNLHSQYHHLGSTIQLSTYRLDSSLGFGSFLFLGFSFITLHLFNVLLVVDMPANKYNKHRVRGIPKCLIYLLCGRMFMRNQATDQCGVEEKREVRLLEMTMRSLKKERGFLAQPCMIAASTHQSLFLCISLKKAHSWSFTLYCMPINDPKRHCYTHLIRIVYQETMYSCCHDGKTTFAHIILSCHEPIFFIDRSLCSI